MNVAQFVTRFDKMIARVNIAVVLECWPVPASRSVDAEQMAAEIRLERHVKHLDVDLANIMAHPFFENIYEELAVLFTADGTVGYETAVLGIEQAFAAGLFAPTLVGNIDRFRTSAFHDGDELHPLGVHLVTKESINGPAMVFVGGVDGTKDIEFDSVFMEQPPAIHHFIEGAFLAAVDPILIVELARTIYAQADQKIVFLKKGTPIIVDKNAVGLKGVFYALFGPAVFFYELDRASEEVNLHQRRLATLPRHGHGRRAVRLQ